MKFTGIITIGFAIFAVASASPLGKRRFGQEHTPRADADFQKMKDIAVGTTFGAQLGDLSGAAVRALLAKAPACDQQDVADQMIDISKQLSAQGFDQKAQDLVAVAKDYRTLERNTPNAGQPSELCNRPPRNPELNGLTQAQDPTGTGGAAGSGGTGNTGGTGDTGSTGGATGAGGSGTCQATATVTMTTTMTTTVTSTATPSCPPTGTANNGGSTGTDNGGSTGADNGGSTGSTGADNGGSTGSTGTDNGGSTGSTAGGNGCITLNNAAFTNPVGGIMPPQITEQNGKFIVNGNSFNDEATAVQRACDVQKNQCFNKFNSGDHSFQGSDCENQRSICQTGQ